MHALVRTVIDPLGDDRYMTDDVERMITLVRHGRIGAEVRRVTEARR